MTLVNLAEAYRAAFEARAAANNRPAWDVIGMLIRKASYDMAHWMEPEFIINSQEENGT